MSATPRLRPARRPAMLPALFLAVIGGGAVLPALPVAAAAPEPAPIPRRWQLDIVPSPLRMTVVNTPGVGPRAYFFMTFKVTNNSPTDLLFAPAFELATDDMEVLRSGRDVPVAVTKEIMGRLESPLLEDQISIVGTLLRGAENAKEGLVIWPVPQLHQSEIAVYCAGFSGETATVEVPATQPVMASAKPLPSTNAPETARPIPEPGTAGGSAKAVSAKATRSSAATPDGSAPRTEKKVLRKTLMLRYRLPGDLNPGQDDPLRPYQSQWIMR